MAPLALLDRHHMPQVPMHAHIIPPATPITCTKGAVVAQLACMEVGTVLGW